MPFAIHSNPPKPKKVKKQDNDTEKISTKPKPKSTKKIGEISISCDDPLCEDNV